MTSISTNNDAGSLRCFFALLPDAASREKLRDCGASVAARGVRWNDAASLHLTLRFFAAATLAQVEYLKHMLPTLARALPAIGGRRCAIWPNRARPRLLVLELDAADVLQTLAHDCEALALKAGFEPEPRDFKAHLTLARLRPGCALEPPSVPAPTLTFQSLVLLASDPQATGARYRSLASIALPLPRRQAGSSDASSG